jgi:hypothetical protein
LRRRRAPEQPVVHKSHEYQILPSWARADLATRSDGANAFLAAGASLVLLDGILRQDAPFIGALRQRLALRATVASARILRLREDGGAVRDATHLALGEESGPAGRLHRLWRSLAGHEARISGEGLSEALNLLNLPDAGAGMAIAARIGGLDQAADPVSAAAAAAATVFGLRQKSEDEVLAFWVADLVLAARLGWNKPVPLLATRILDPALRRGAAGRRARPGDATWVQDAARAYALAVADAYALAAQLGRRSQQLVALQPKLRAKGAARVVDLLLADDCISSARAAKNAGLSDRAARRLFERLVELGSVREVSGRPSFRLYGL